MHTKPAHNNCFDLLRHLAAFLVLYSHHYALSGRAEPSFLGVHSLGGFSVLIFFSISGYLVSKSYMRSTDFIDFLQKRSLRIFPALIVCSIFMVYVLGSIYGSNSASETFFGLSSLRNVVGYTAFLGTPIPGVFDDYIFKSAVNGSLWTLPIEFTCYLLVGLALCLSKSAKPVISSLVILIAACLIVKHMGIQYKFWQVQLGWLTLFGASFFVGAVMAQCEGAWKEKKLFLTIISIAMLVAAKGKPEMQLAVHLAVPILTLVIGTSFRENIVAGRYDISYGVYIYAFPMQQICINGWGLGFWSSMLAAAVLTTLLATMSWRWVEKPALSLKSTPKDVKAYA